MPTKYATESEDVPGEIILLGTLGVKLNIDKILKQKTAKRMRHERRMKIKNNGGGVKCPNGCGKIYMCENGWYFNHLIVCKPTN